jgi:predicted metal-dependent hydrolase
MVLELKPHYSQAVKKVLFMFLIILSAGCHSADIEEDSYIVWVKASEQNQELQDSAYQRLKDADIDYKFDKNGNILIREMDLEKAVMCCT